MEDDDEFGDLYTDVLRPVSSIAPPQPSLFPSASPASAPNPPPDLNIHSDDEDILYGASNPKSSLHSQTISSEPEKVGKDRISVRRIDDASNWNDNDRVEEQEEEKKEDQEEKVLAWVSNVRASNSPKLDVTRSLETGDGELRQAEEARVSETPEHFEKSKTGEAIVEEGDKNGDLMAESDVFLGEEVGEKAEIDVGIDDLESEPIIPGISSGPFIPGLFDDAGNGGGDGPKASRRDDSAGGGDDWDSDSEDDLQIVLNDNSGPIGVDRNGGMGSDDEDEDGEDLVIVADGDQHHQPIEPQEWGEDLAQVADGERKEGDEAVKMNGGMVNALGARIGYSNHVYHPHHSQFKYVRPGAAAMSGGAMVGHGGAPGQVRPLVNTGPIAGRGRGDWRPIGVKTTTTMQKSFHSGFGLPVWATNSSGRGFGNGLEFTLPPHKTVFDTDIDSFEEKPWRHPGVDTSDFFNFGLDEEKWKDYCKQLEQLRLEATMQSKIRVYESGRSEQDYDPDLPPELAAAVGLHDASLENAQLGKTDGGQSDSMGQGRGAARVRPPIPTGRAIQVEGGYGERLPSIDTRPPRIRDSDAIIEIVLQDSADDSNTDNGALEQPENAPRGDDCKGDPEIEDLEQTDTEYFGDHFPQTYNGRKREMVGRKAPGMGSVHDNINEGDGILPLPPETPLQYHNGPKGRTPVYPGRILGTPHEGRWSQRTVRGRYPQVTAGHGNDMAPSQIDSGKKFSDNQEKSGESINGKQTPESSPITEKASREPSVEHKDDVHNDHVMAKRSTEVEGEEMALDAINPSDNFGDGALLHSVKKQKLSSRVEQPTFQEVGDGDDLRATRSSDNSKARSGSSRDYQKWREGGEEEVVQDGQSRHMGDTKRHREEDEHSFRKRDDYVRDGRHETDRNRLVVKGREDSYHSYPQRDRDPSSAHYLRKKAEDFERPKERDNSVGARQRRDEEAHERRGKNEDAWKREHVEEMGSRHRSKVQESERNDKDEHFHSRKRLENGDWRGRHDKEVGPKHRERDDSLMSRHENLDDPHSKRRKDEDHQRREHAEKEVLHGYRAREETSRRKRERDDVLDQRRRDDQVKVRDRPDDHHSVRHREESWRLRERDERQRLKQSHEDTLSKRGIEEGRGASRSGRGTEDKLWTGNVRGKDESKDLGSDKDQFKDRRRHSEQTKKRDRTEDETLSQHRGRVDFYARDNQINFEERNSRHERSSSRNDRPVNASDRQLLHKERPKENTRKSKESEGGDQNALGPAKRKQEDHSVHQNEKVSMKGLSEQESGKLALGPSDSHDPGQSRSSTVLSKKSHYERESPQQRHSSRKHREAAPSDDEQQNSRRGRSKLERWASHKEKDDNTNAHTSSPSPKVKETNRNNNERSSLASEQPDESAKTVEAVDNHLPLLEDGNIGDLEMKDVDMGTTPGNQYESDKIEEDRHLDTVAKLKKRSERFKLPMPSEKDSTSNRKIESEALPSAKSETAADAEIKQERPARKRRWTSN